MCTSYTILQFNYNTLFSGHEVPIICRCASVVFVTTTDEDALRIRELLVTEVAQSDAEAEENEEDEAEGNQSLMDVHI